MPLPAVGSDFDFFGGRTLVINGMPVAQLGYRDQDGQLLAICFMRYPTGEPKQTSSTRIDRLLMVDWRDADFQYVVIGYGSLAKIGGVAGQVRGSYEL